MRLVLCFIFAFFLTHSAYSQPDETYRYHKNKKQIQFQQDSDTISLSWSRGPNHSRELCYKGFSDDYRMSFRGNHPTVLYRGSSIVAHFKDLDILVNDKIYHYGEGIPEHWVFMHRDSVVVDCRYEDLPSGKLINFHYNEVPPEDLEILKVLAFKRGNEVARPKTHIPVLIGGGLTLGLAGILVYAFANR